MTSKERIEELLNYYGKTLEDLPKRPKIGFVYSEEDLSDANNMASSWSFGEGFHDCSSLVLLDFICHQSDVIEKLVKALESANQAQIKCKDCKCYKPCSDNDGYCTYWYRGTDSNAYCSYSKTKETCHKRSGWIGYGTNKGILWVNPVDKKEEFERYEESDSDT